MNPEQTSSTANGLTLRVAHEQLPVQDAHYRQLFEQAADAIFVHDLQGRYYDVNPAGCELLGYTREELLGITLQAIDPSCTPAHLHEVGERLRGRGPFVVTTRNRRKDGSEVPVEIRVALFQPGAENPLMLAVVRDITTRARAEAEVRQLAAIVESSDRAILSTTVDGTILTWNPGAERIYGYRAEQIVGRLLSTLALHPEAGCESSLQECLREMRVLNARAIHRRHDGTPLKVALTYAPIRDAVGALVGISIIGRDVTEEEARERQIRRAERLSSLATLIGGVAHELNNPLSAIKSFAQLMLLDEHSPEDHEALEIMQNEADRAARIVSDLRLFARDAHGAHDEPLARVELNEVVRDVLRMRASTLHARGIEVRTDLQPELQPTFARRDLITQAVLSLVVNAEQALAEADGPRRLTLSTTCSGPDLRLEITDTGRGIEAEHLERIFDPFWTTKGPGRGAGLGLSLAHGIVSDHGGRLRVESRLGHGSTFTVELAVAPAEAPRAP